MDVLHQATPLKEMQILSALEDLRCGEQLAVITELQRHVQCRKCGEVLGKKSRKLQLHEQRLAALDAVLAERRE